ncbi:hypothetical protein V8G54_029067, partial [Vigna mungo]
GFVATVLPSPPPRLLTGSSLLLTGQERRRGPPSISARDIATVADHHQSPPHRCSRRNRCPHRHHNTALLPLHSRVSYLSLKRQTPSTTPIAGVEDENVFRMPIIG